MFSTICTETFFGRRLAGRSLTDAPTSSITSIALSGKKAVVDIFSGKLGRGSQRFVAVFDAVMLLVKFLEAFEYLDMSHRSVGSPISIF